MRRPRLAILGPVAMAAALLAMPAGVLAADPVTLTGTVVRDGLPQPGVQVGVIVTASDIIASATTDDEGAFSVGVEAAIGTEVRISARGQLFQSDPDARGCVHTEMLAGSAVLIVEAIPPAPVEVVLDQLVTGTVCPAAGTPRITPPATDGLVAPRPGGASGGGLLAVVGVLALAGSASLALAHRRP
jgi:hypothetical protein